jgi:hypothetical protein
MTTVGQRIAIFLPRTTPHGMKSRMIYPAMIIIRLQAICSGSRKNRWSQALKVL